MSCVTDVVKAEKTEPGQTAVKMQPPDDDHSKVKPQPSSDDDDVSIVNMAAKPVEAAPVAMEDGLLHSPSPSSRSKVGLGQRFRGDANTYRQSLLFTTPVGDEPPVDLVVEPERGGDEATDAEPGQEEDGIDEGGEEEEQEHDEAHESGHEFCCPDADPRLSTIEAEIKEVEKEMYQEVVRRVSEL